MAVFGNDLEPWQIMVVSNFKIVKIVGRGNFDRAGAVLGIGVLVGDDRDFAVGQREMDSFSYQIFVTSILGVNRDGGITKESLWTSS